MGFIVKIDASESITLDKTTVEKVLFKTDTPNDSNARSTDLGMELTIIGKIRAKVKDATADESVKLANWSIVPAEDPNCYGTVNVQAIAGGKVAREITFDAAYVVSYTETFADESGVGRFTLVVRQKKDTNSSVDYQGGFDY